MQALRDHSTSALSAEIGTPQERGFGEAERLASDARATGWTGQRLLGYEAMRLLVQLDSELLEARAQWNQDWFRRIMRIRPKAVSRLRRRWAKLEPAPAIPLGSLRRRYHANLAGYLYER
jgi:hypothetical protein